MLPKDLNRTLVIFFIFVASVSCALITNTFAQLKFAAGADEGYYLRYANYISSHGLSGFRDLFSYYLNDKAHWVFPNPLRIAYFGLSALSVTILGSSFFSLVIISLAAFFVYLLVSFYFIRKYFDTQTAFLTGILLAFSPLNMALARRALSDAVVNMSAVVAIWLFFDALKERKRWKFALFACVYAAAILIRENTVLLALFFLTYLLFRSFSEKVPVKLSHALLVTVIPLGAVGLLYVMSAGSISKVFAVAGIILKSPATNEYAILYGCGPWYRFIIDFLLLSPWTAILAIGFCLHYFSQRERRDTTTYLILLISVMLLLAGFFTKNIRYLVMLDMPLRLLAVLALKGLTVNLPRQRQFIVLLFAVGVIASFDFLNFRSLFIDQGIYDPITAWLLKGQHIIP